MPLNLWQGRTAGHDRTVVGDRDAHSAVADGGCSVDIGAVGDWISSNATRGVGRHAAPATSAAAAIVASDASISSTLPNVVIVDAIVMTSPCIFSITKINSYV